MYEKVSPSIYMQVTWRHTTVEAQNWLKHFARPLVVGCRREIFVGGAQRYQITLKNKHLFMFWANT